MAQTQKKEAKTAIFLCFNTSDNNVCKLHNNSCKKKGKELKLSSANKGLTGMAGKFRFFGILKRRAKKNCRRNTELAPHIVLLRSSKQVWLVSTRTAEKSSD